MSWLEISCKCPFYAYDNGTKVGCDKMVLYFHDKGIRKRYIHDYCCGDYKKCSIAIKMGEFYEKNIKESR